METQGYSLPDVSYSPVASSSLLSSNVQTPAMSQPWQTGMSQQGMQQGMSMSQQQPWQQSMSQPWQQQQGMGMTQQGMHQQHHGRHGSPQVVQYERDIYTKKKKTSIVGCFPLLVFAVIAMILLFVTIFIPGSATTKILALVIAMIFAIIFALLIWLTCSIVWLSWGMVVLATAIWIVMLILVYNNIVKITT